MDAQERSPAGAALRMAVSVRDRVDMLARLRVAVITGCLPREVGQWALQIVAAQVPAQDRIAARDELLRLAAAEVRGSSREKAQYIWECSVARGLPDAGTEAIRVLVQSAARHARIPQVRQLRRILVGHGGTVNVPGRRARVRRNALTKAVK